MSCAKSVAGTKFRQQQQPQQKHAKTQQQKFTKATASQTNSNTNQTLTTTQTVNCSQSSPASSSSKTSTSTSPIATNTYMASSTCSSSSFSFESGVILSGSSGCSSLSNSPTSSSNPYLASLGVPSNLSAECTAAAGNSLCVNNATHLDESFSSTCILNASLLAAVNGDLEDESAITSQSLSDTLCSSQSKSDTLQNNEDNSGQQQILLENINNHHHQQLSVAETTCLNTEDARTLQLAVELTMMNLNQLPSPTSPAATSSSSVSTTTTTNNFQQLLQQPHRLHSSLDQPYSSPYTSVSNPYHMTTKVFLQTQSQAAAATLLNQKYLSDTSLSDSPTKLNTLPPIHNQTLGGTAVAIDDRSKKSQNMTECVPVPSSEHVAEIVGRQGCKIKALRAKTNTYIKTPVRNEEPVFVVTGRKEDVAKAKREILSAAEHFTLIRATRRTNDGISACAAGLGSGGLGGGVGHLIPFNKNSLSSATPLPGQVTIQVRVPYRVVGLVVGPKGNTIKHIQHETQTYIVTPSRDKEPIFEVTGTPDNVQMARKEIEEHIAIRTGNSPNNSLAIPAPPPPPPPPPAPAGTINQLGDTIASTQASLQSLNALSQMLNDDLQSEILSSIYKNGIGSALEYSQIGANVINTTNNKCHNSNPFNASFVGEINPTVLSVNDIQRRIINAGNSNVNMQLNCTDFINNLMDSNAAAQFVNESNTNFPQLTHNANAIRNLKSVINTINLLENSNNGDAGTFQQQNCSTSNALLTRSCSSASSTASSSKSFNNGGNNSQYWKSMNSATTPASKGTCGNGVAPVNDNLDIDEGIGESPLYSWGLPNTLSALTNSYCSPASTSISPTDSLFGEHHNNSKNTAIQNQQCIGSAKTKLLEKLKRSNCWMCQDKDIVAALLPCGHKMFCMECANRLCQQNEVNCPVCSTQVYQSVRI